MSKPYIHALSSVKAFGGVAEDYMGIHELLDSSKSVCSTGIHRALTHHTWFISTIIVRIFGETFKNSDGKVVSSRDVAERHVAEDYKGRFIPSAQDFLAQIEWKDWMNNGAGVPPSFAKIEQAKVKRVKHLSYERRPTPPSGLID